MNDALSPSLPLLVSARGRMIATIVLALLAVLGNHLHLPLFFGVDFIFGSIAALMALLLVGPLSAVFVAAVGGIYTVYLWGHPYALLLFALEPFVVGLLQRRISQVAVADAVYWAICGVPLVLLIYPAVLGMEWDQVALVSFKLIVNGVMNAVIACLAVSALLMLRPGAAGSPQRIPIANLLFNVLLAMGVLVGLLPVALDNYIERDALAEHVDSHLREPAEFVARGLTADRAPESVLAELPLQAGVSVALRGADGTVIAARGALRSLRERGRLETMHGDMRIWLPDESKSAMQRWREGVYVHDRAVAGHAVTQVRVEQAATPLVAHIEHERLAKMILLTAVLGAILLVAWWLSRWLTRSVQQIEEISRDLPERLAAGTAPHIVGSRIAEYDGLAHSIRAMAGTLSTSFRAVHDMRATLEQRVLERTAELERREAMLAESEARFRNMANAAPALIWLSDTDNLGIWYNNRWLEYTGRTLEQELGLGWAAGVHPEDLDRCVRYCNDAFAARTAFEMEFRLRRADGSYGWIADTGIPRFDASGRFEGYIGYCWDITDRKQAEFALRRQQQLGDAIAGAQSRFIREGDRRTAFEVLLSDILSLTESEYGFIGEVLHTADGRPYLKTHAISNIAWDDASRAFYAEQAPRGMEFSNLDTLFGAVMLGGEPVVANDPANHPHSGGLPPGHPPLRAFLGVPIHVGKDMVAMFGLANRVNGYDASLVEFLRPLSATLGNLVEALRHQRRRQEDQAALTRLSAVASQTTDGVIITDLDGHVEWINEGFTRISGYTLDELRGRKPGSILQGPESDPATIAVMRHALRHREPFVVELINYGKNGAPYWIRINCNPLLDAAGTMQGFMAIQSDLTAEKRAAERISESERRLAAVIEGTHIGTWEWNVQTGATVFNERWADIVGYTLDELAPISIETWVKLAHPDDLQRSNEMLHRHFAGEVPYYDVECRMQHKAGHWVWVHDRGRVVTWVADGKPLLMSGTHADISEQKNAEAALLASEAQYRSLVVNIPGAAYQCAADADWTTMYVSDAIEALTGYPPSDFIGNSVRSYASLILEDDRDRVRRQVGEAVQANESWTIEYRLVDKDGEMRWVFEKGQALRDDGGGIVCLSGFVHDITDRKRMERMKDEFVSTVSHELRTPLTSITGSLGLLAGGALGGLPDPAQRMLEVAHKNGQRLARLIDDLLDMEKLAAGKMSLDLQVQELTPLVEQALLDNQAYAERFKVAFKLADRVEGARVRVDALRLQQVLANLLSNAAKFSPEGATVDVVVEPRDGCVRVAVIDGGPGISDAFQPRVFEKFSQADASTTRQRGGTGLGLAISKELIERMHGTIGFRNEPGRGACFYFELPVW